MTVKKIFFIFLISGLVVIFHAPAVNGQTCSGSVGGNRASCVQRGNFCMPEEEDKYTPTVEDCSYNVVSGCGANVNEGYVTWVRRYQLLCGEWWEWQDCTAHNPDVWMNCGPADPDPTPPGQTPPPGATPTPAGSPYADFRFVDDTDHDGNFDGTDTLMCTALSGVDRFVKKVGSSCMGCTSYTTESGYTAGGIAHENFCAVSASLAVPITRVPIPVSPTQIPVVVPANRYVINRLSTNTCSVVDGDSLKYSCPNGGTATLLVSDVQNACDISVTGPATLTESGSGNLSVTRDTTATITGLWISGTTGTGSISYDPSPVSWNGTPSPYTFAIIGESAGSVTVTVKGVNSATGIQCSATHSLTVTASLQPWWVTFGGDVTAGGNIVSNVPVNQYLFNWLTVTPVMSSGIPITGPTNMLDVGVGNISDTGRFANTNTYNLNTTYTALLAKAAKTASFITLAPGTHNLADITSSPDAQGWEWYKTEGDLTLDDAGAFTFSSRKVVVFVEGNLTVNKNIQCVDGVGMPVFIVSGDIIFNSTVAASTTLFEGAYYAGGNTGITFNTNGVDTDPTLTVRAIVVAQNGSVTSYRDSGVGNTVPAVYFRRTPDLMFLMPSFMRSKKSLWREVAP